MLVSQATRADALTWRPASFASGWLPCRCTLSRAGDGLSDIVFRRGTVRLHFLLIKQALSKVEKMFVSLAGLFGCKELHLETEL